MRRDGSAETCSAPLQVRMVGGVLPTARSGGGFRTDEPVVVSITSGLCAHVPTSLELCAQRCRRKRTQTSHNSAIFWGRPS